jgi:outer membrane protein TolC
MHKTFIILIITGFVLFAGFSMDQTGDANNLKLDIDTAVSMALSNNLSLKNNKIDLNNKLLKMATSWNTLVPTTNLSVSMGQTNSTATVLTKRMTTTTNSLGAGFSLNFSLSPQVGFEIVQTVLDYQTGKITYDQAKNTLITDINKAYYNIVLMKQQLDLKQKQMDNTKRNYDLSVIKLERGMISEIDKLKSEYAYKSVIPDYNTLNNTYITAIMNFKIMIGVKNEKDIELVSDIPEISKLDYDKISSMSIENNSDLKILTQSLRTNENLRNTYISALFPSFGISYSASTNFNQDFTKDSWSDPNNWNNSGTFNFSVKMPLDPYFPFSSTQVNMIQTQNNIQKNINDIKNTTLQKKANVSTDILTLKQIEDTINSLKINVDIAQKTYDMTQKLFDAGSKNYLDLQDAQNNLYDSQIKLINARYNYMTNYLDLKTLLNIDKL